MKEKLYSILKHYWSFTEFREPQLEIISAVVTGQDGIAVLPTGYGKSICYQIPGLYLDGVCLVISPLIALMKDQASALERKGIKTVMISSHQSLREQDILLDNVVYGEVKFLFVSPERLNSDLFKARLAKMNVSMVAIDEAHCISEWGHDFRPSYRSISILKDFLPTVPFIALTATATEKVIRDIEANLKLHDAFVIRRSPVRKNLSYFTIKTESKKHEILSLLDGNTPAIIYVNRRKTTKEIESFLGKYQIKASAFHAGIDNQRKMSIIEEWNKNNIDVIVATNAFGMGMDKSNVRSVIHYNLSNSLESYVQEAGRAGRDTQAANAYVLWNNFDLIELKENIESQFPEKKDIKSLYHKLALFLSVASGKTSDEWLNLDLYGFCASNNFSIRFCLSALKILSDASYLDISDKFKNPTRLYLNDQAVKLYLRDKSNPLKFKEVLKEILRSYDGITWDFRPINESLIAKKCQITEKQFFQFLNHIEKLDLGKFSYNDKSYNINFKSYRFNSAEIKFPESIYELKKKQKLTMAKQMHAYLKSEVCRQTFIADYFGFKTSKVCGICDNCQDELNSQSIKHIVLRFKEKDEVLILDMLKGLSGQNKNKLLTYLEELKTENKILINNNKVYFVNAK